MQKKLFDIVVSVAASGSTNLAGQQMHTQSTKWQAVILCVKLENCKQRVSKYRAQIEEQ